MSLRRFFALSSALSSCDTRFADDPLVGESAVEESELVPVVLLFGEESDDVEVSA